MIINNVKVVLEFSQICVVSWTVLGFTKEKIQRKMKIFSNESGTPSFGDGPKPKHQNKTHQLQNVNKTDNMWTN